MYETDFIPSDGGMVDGGNVVLSKYKLEDAPEDLHSEQMGLLGSIFT